MKPTVHIIGAGVSGLAAAVRLSNAGFGVHVHEATAQAGGRCRSFYDAATDLTIDNGNHLVLSGNKHVLDYARSIGTEAGLEGPPHAQFSFVDLKAGKRWLLQMNDGRIPFWIFQDGKRVPDTKPSDYTAMAPLLWAKNNEFVGDKIECDGPLYQRLVQPLLLAALNIDPPLGSAGLAGAIVRQTLLAGGRACRPLIAREGLSNVLVEPAVKLLRDCGATVRFDHELHRFDIAADRVQSLTFGNDTIMLGPDDKVVLAVPARQAASILPGLTTPTQFVSILNAHFRCTPPADTPPILGVVNGLVEWIFPFRERLSITISAADRLMNAPREQLARDIWSDVRAATGVQGELPRWQIVRERRATFAATPEQDALRPGTVTAWKNLVLAGDWTATGLPSTIEGSIQSGDKAADHIIGGG
jgi:squalene-associated FAD-dependent desaturase